MFNCRAAVPASIGSHGSFFMCHVTGIDVELYVTAQIASPITVIGLLLYGLIRTFDETIFVKRLYFFAKCISQTLKFVPVSKMTLSSELLIITSAFKSSVSLFFEKVLSLKKFML